MGQTYTSNKRRRTPLIDNKLHHNFIYTTLLTVKYSKEAYARLKKESDTGSSVTIRKRCRALMAKMSEPGLGSARISAIAGCSRNLVDQVVHMYNNGGIESVLTVAPKPGRPNRLEPSMEEISRRLDTETPRSAAQALDIVAAISGTCFSHTWIREVMHRCGFRFIKTQPIPGQACPDKQRQWVTDLQEVVAEAEAGSRKLYFMDAVHFTLEAFTTHVWCREPVHLKTRAGRNRFNLLGCVDPSPLT